MDPDYDRDMYYQMKQDENILDKSKGMGQGDSRYNRNESYDQFKYDVRGPNTNKTKQSYCYDQVKESINASKNSAKQDSVPAYNQYNESYQRSSYIENETNHGLSNNQMDARNDYAQSRPSYGTEQKNYQMQQQESYGNNTIEQQKQFGQCFTQLSAGQNFRQEQTSSGINYASHKSSSGQDFCQEQTSSGRNYDSEQPSSGRDFRQEQTSSSRNDRRNQSSSDRDFSPKQTEVGRKYSHDQSSSSKTFYQEYATLNKNYSHNQPSLGEDFSNEQTTDYTYNQPSFDRDSSSERSTSDKDYTSRNDTEELFSFNKKGSKHSISAPKKEHYEDFLKRKSKYDSTKVDDYISRESTLSRSSYSSQQNDGKRGGPPGQPFKKHKLSSDLTDVNENLTDVNENELRNKFLQLENDRRISIVNKMSMVDYQHGSGNGEKRSGKVLPIYDKPDNINNKFVPNVVTPSNNKQDFNHGKNTNDDDDERLFNNVMANYTKSKDGSKSDLYSHQSPPYSMKSYNNGITLGTSQLSQGTNINPKTSDISMNTVMLNNLTNNNINNQQQQYMAAFNNFPNSSMDGNINWQNNMYQFPMSGAMQQFANFNNTQAISYPGNMMNPGSSMICPSNAGTGMMYPSNPGTDMMYPSHPGTKMLYPSNPGTSMISMQSGIGTVSQNYGYRPSINPGPSFWNSKAPLKHLILIIRDYIGNNPPAISILVDSVKSCIMTVTYTWDKKIKNTCSIIVNGENLGTATGSNSRDAKEKCALTAMKYLMKICYSIKIKTVVTPELIVTPDDFMKKQEPTTSECVDNPGIGSRLMKSMGWSGGALGKSGIGITEPIHPSANTARKGLGMDVKSGEFYKTANNMIKSFNKNGNLTYLAFDEAFGPIEREQFHSIANSMDIEHSYVWANNRHYLVLTRKFSMTKLLKDLMNVGGVTNMFQVFPPGSSPIVLHNK